MLYAIPAFRIEELIAEAPLKFVFAKARRGHMRGPGGLPF